MYEFIILAQLMRGRAHGYLIAKIINDMIGPYAHLSPGRLYPLLAKMEQDGLIAVDTDAQSNRSGNRQLRIYRITDAGRMRFQVLMHDTSSNQGDYRTHFLQKVCMFDFISLAGRLRLIDHYINYCQTHIFHLQTEIEEMKQEPYDTEPSSKTSRDYLSTRSRDFAYVLKVMHHYIAQWQIELDWAWDLRRQEATHVEASHIKEIKPPSAE